MVNKITIRTIYCIIALAAGILPLTACTGRDSEIEESGIRETEATRAVVLTVDVPATEVVEPAGDVSREVATAVMVTPTGPSPTPAPMAVSTVRATATAKPTPGLTPYTSGWEFFEGPPDLMVRGRSHGLRVEGTVISPADYTGLLRDPGLYLRCDADLMEAYVIWGRRFIAANFSTETIATVYKVDDETPVNTTSGESEGNEASFFMDPIRFVRDLMDSEKVVIRVTDYDDTEMTAVFPTSGLSADVAKLSCWQ